jgi:hypothetical protein
MLGVKGTVLLMTTVTALVSTLQATEILPCTVKRQIRMKKL